MSNSHGHGLHKLSIGGALVALGIIFGDIGTSPLYVFKAIIGEAPISEELIYGGVSSVFWTLTLITTFKYVFLALRSDNKGEGGIFALYALVRRHKVKWVIYPAIIGSASLLADGFITPPISISSAVEGLEFIPFLHEFGIHHYILPLVLGILVALFVIQQFGTHKIGGTFGPVMFIWFTMLTILGLYYIVQNPMIIKALNPLYAINMIVHTPGGFWLLGGVFLCTTGAEALYSDLGHVGRQNIQVSWVLVKVALIINYLGQGSYLLQHLGEKLDIPPFYGMMPTWFLPYGVIVATSATIIASQALITGTFTLANEAMKLKLWPNLKVSYPSQLRGQIYIPAMNWILLAGCIAVVLLFRESKNMEAAYGLAITINMLMTTTLLTWHLYAKHKKDDSFIKNPYTVVLILIAFIVVEGAFFLSNVVKFTHGGWFTLMIAIFFFGIMYVLYHARILRAKYTDFVDFNEETEEMILDISKDYTITRESTNLVYLCMSSNPREIDKNILYSITRKRPKRADVYWFLHVDIADEPYVKQYSYEELIPKKCFFVRLRFGFKVEHKVNVMFRFVVDELIKMGRIDEFSHYPSLRKHKVKQDFKFILLNSRVSVDEVISPFEQFIIRAYRVIKNMSLSQVEQFGLDMTNVEVENVPITISKRKEIPLVKVAFSNSNNTTINSEHHLEGNGVIESGLENIN